MKNTQKSNTLESLRGLMKLYKDLDGYIDEDAHIFIYYNSGEMKVYPDNVESIKQRNIKNVVFMSGDCGPMDFEHDFIGTQEDFDSMKEIEIMNNCSYEYQNILIVEDMNEWYKTQEQ